MAKFPYSDTVLEHFRHPHNVGKMEDPDGESVVGSPACGDMVAVYIKVDRENNVIEKAMFESYGCASNIATGSIITDLARGKTLDEAKKIDWKQASAALGGLPPIKTHCSVLAVDGLRAAILNYEEKNGLVKERVPTTVDEITKRLKYVFNPLTGLDLVRGKLIREITFDDGHVKIVVDLPPDHIFANNIREEIDEKISHLWDVKSVEIQFIS